MTVIGTYEFKGSAKNATFNIKGLNGSVQLPFDHFEDGVIRTYDGDDGLFYVHFDMGDDESMLKSELEMLNYEELRPWETSQGKIALYHTEQSLARVYIHSWTNDDSITVFAIDSGTIHKHSHRSNLLEIPENLKNFAPQVVPVKFKLFSSDLLLKNCLDDVKVSIRLYEGDPIEKGQYFRADKLSIFLPDGNTMAMVDALRKHREFKKYVVKDAPQTYTCCFKDDRHKCYSPPQQRGLFPAAIPQVGGMTTTTTTVSPVTQPAQTDNHTLITCVVVFGAVGFIIVVIFLAAYLYKRFGHVISERHRREHHRHRRNRTPSQQNSDQGSPSSSNKREPVQVPTEGPLPSIPNDNVIARLPQHNIVSKECPHSYSQVNRTISPMVQENSASPNRAMTPLKTAEMSTQTYTRSAEPVHENDVASNKAEPSGSRMAAGSTSTSALSEATLQPSLHSRRTTNQSVCPQSTSSHFEIGRVANRPTVVNSKDTRISTTDFLTTAGPTMADVTDSDEDDEDSVTRSVDDCERVLAAYQPPVQAAPAPVSAHRTKSYHSTCPLYDSTSHNSDYSTHGSDISGGHLISLPGRSSRREEKRRHEEESQPRPQKPINLSRISVPTDLLTPRSASTNSDLHTAIRRESTVSWLADSTQSSMGRSMGEDDFSL